MEPESLSASAPSSGSPPPSSAPEGTAGAPGVDQGAPSPERSEGVSGRWFQSALDHLRGRSTSAGPQRTETAPDPPPEGPEAPPAWTPAASAEEERRRFQSRRDAELTAQRRQQYQQEQQERQQTIATLEARKDELLRSGAQPWEIGEEVAQLEGQILAVKDGGQADDQQGKMIGTITSFYDQIYADAYLAGLPVAERQKLLAQEWNGIEGRQQLAGAILQSLKAHWQTEGATKERDRLQKSPGYRKQLTHEFGLGRETPESVPAAMTGRASATADMNTWIRRATGR